MADFVLKLNDAAIIQQARAAFKEANELFAREALAEIDAKKWDWPNETERSNGSVVGSPRNIVDQGGLKGSYQPDAKPDEYSHTWDADYAAAVALGAVLSDGTTLPARNWTEEPAKNLESNYEQLLEVKLK